MKKNKKISVNFKPKDELIERIKMRLLQFKNIYRISLGHYSNGKFIPTTYALAFECDIFTIQVRPHELTMTDEKRSWKQ